MNACDCSPYDGCRGTRLGCPQRRPRPAPSAPAPERMSPFERRRRAAQLPVADLTRTSIL